MCLTCSLTSNVTPQRGLLCLSLSLYPLPLRRYILAQILEHSPQIICKSSSVISIISSDSYDSSPYYTGISNNSQKSHNKNSHLVAEDYYLFPTCGETELEKIRQLYLRVSETEKKKCFQNLRFIILSLTTSISRIQQLNMLSCFWPYQFLVFEKSNILSRRNFTVSDKTCYGK